MKNNINKLLFIIIYSFITVSFLYAAPINNFIDSVSPAMNSINSGTSDNIIIYFSQDMNIFTINNTGIKVTGNQTGYMSAVVTYDIILKTAVINTDQDFKTGEKIYVNVDSTVKTSGNIPVDAISYNFTAGATRGDGNFTVSNFSGNNLIPDNIFPGDYDNDGNVDLMIFDMDSHTASLFKNDGAGNFILSNTILLDTILVPTFTTGDYDNDGDLDIAYVIGVYGVFDLQVLLNNGDGTFIEGYFGPYNHDRIPDSGMMSCDFNNDGLIDILLFGNGRFFGSVFLLPNLGNGVFSVQGITLTQNICSQNYLIVYAYVNSYAAGDFNNDGNLDILIFSYMNWLNMNGDFEECYSIRSMVNDGNGSFSENAVYSITEGLTVYCTGDFNNDGYTDVLCNGKILLNDGTGLFSIVTSPINGGACAAADFDSDGDLDVAVSEGSGVMLYKNNGNAEFSEPVSFSTGSGPGAICSANFDGDCDID
ncbi:MAG TPA: FG-GAP-like repeat-containing protein, partial [Ignavibacteria bacterium]|nr:FG-GAP-like repeat-containing protein [Ignavibacteria bacterium]